MPILYPNHSPFRHRLWLLKGRIIWAVCAALLSFGGGFLAGSEFQRKCYQEETTKMGAKLKAMREEIGELIGKNTAEVIKAKIPPKKENPTLGGGPTSGQSRVVTSGDRRSTR